MKVPKTIAKYRPEMWLLGGGLGLLALWVWRTLRAQGQANANALPAGYFGLNDPAAYAMGAGPTPGWAFLFKIPPTLDVYKPPFSSGAIRLITEGGKFITTESGSDIVTEN
jgi:hypothetical protein